MGQDRNIERFVLPAPWDIMTTSAVIRPPIRNGRTTLWEAFLGFSIAFAVAADRRHRNGPSRFIRQASCLLPC
jgi:ABC-type nitrate/sulfonate/bicarbonate transport system permease component